MRFPKWVGMAMCLLFVGLVGIAGCNAHSRNRADASASAARTVPDATADAAPDKAVDMKTQMFEIGRGGNLVARAAVPLEVEADLYLAGETAPRRTIVRLLPGTWFVPEQLFTIDPAPGPGVVCTETYCEVAR